MEKNKSSKSSSLLVSTPALCIWAVLAVLSAAAAYMVLAALFLFFLLLFSSVRYWAAKAMDAVSLEVHCETCRLYPGMDTRIDYEIKNDKFLPLTWLELSQQRPDKQCLMPDEGFEAYTYLKEDGENISEICAYKRSFSLVMGYESMSFATTWHAKRRGIYRPKELLLRSGDGFGLCRQEKSYPHELLPELVVYPCKVPVDTEIFLRQDWDKNYGALGFVEDMSVIRGIRPYSSTDSWKRINWRMAAREPGTLSVNFFETVQPSSVQFVVDGESYCNDEDALERVLELVASLITELGSRSVSCGLSLPKSRMLSAVNFSCQLQLPVQELLYSLAAYELLKSPVMGKDGRPIGEYYPSVFELNELGRSAADAGTVAVFTHKASTLPAALLDRIEPGRLIVFYTGEPGTDKDLRQMHVSALRKGSGA